MSASEQQVPWSILLLTVTLGFTGGLGAYTFRYAEGFSYLKTDPKACANCHIMREHYDGWQKASHHPVATCNDCHTPHDLVGKYASKAENGFWHSKGFTLQDFHEPIRIKPRNSAILQQNCQNCHHDLLQQLVNVHDDAPERRLDCVHCHSDVGHGPTR